MFASTLVSKGGAVCGNSARTDLRGGRAAILVPTVTRKLETYLAGLPSRPLEQPDLPERAVPLKPKKRKDGKPRGNEPQMNLEGELTRICGVDLTSIDGISTISAMTIISEIGSDMSKFPDEHHFSSWLGLTGNKNISGGKPIRGPKRKVKKEPRGRGKAANGRNEPPEQ